MNAVELTATSISVPAIPGEIRPFITAPIAPTLTDKHACGTVMIGGARRGQSQARKGMVGGVSTNSLKANNLAYANNSELEQASAPSVTSIALGTSMPNAAIKASITCGRHSVVTRRKGYKIYKIWGVRSTRIGIVLPHPLPHQTHSNNSGNTTRKKTNTAPFAGKESITKKSVWSARG